MTNRASPDIAIATQLRAALGGAITLIGRPRLCGHTVALVDLEVIGAEDHPIRTAIAEASGGWDPSALAATAPAHARALARVDETSRTSWRRRLGLGPGRELQWLVFDGDDTLVGWIVVLELDGLPALRRGHARRMKSVYDEVRTALVRRHRREAERAQSGYLVLDAEGQIVGQSPQLLGWASRPDLTQTFGQVCLRDGAATTTLALPYATLTLTRVDGAATTRWIAEVRAPEFVYRSPESVLTPAQRAVAAHAASGATCAEISAALQASVETVRTHLREVYRRLEVNSRAELAQVLMAG